MISQQARSGNSSRRLDGLVRDTRVATRKNKTVHEEIRAGHAVITPETLVAIIKTVGSGSEILANAHVDIAKIQAHQKAMMKTIMRIGD